MSEARERRHELVGGKRVERPEALHHHLFVIRSLVAGPRRLEQRQAEEPLAVDGGADERRGPAARVADEMEAVEAVSVRFADDSLGFQAQAVVRRRPIFRVQLEILRHGLDTLAENVEQGRVRRFGR